MSQALVLDPVPAAARVPPAAVMATQLKGVVAKLVALDPRPDGQRVVIMKALNASPLPGDLEDNFDILFIIAYNIPHKVVSMHYMGKVFLHLNALLSGAPSFKIPLLLQSLCAHG